MKSQYGLDKHDLEAMAEGAAVRHFHREYAVARPLSRLDARRRGIVRGKKGGETRLGMLHLAKK